MAQNGARSAGQGKAAGKGNGAGKGKGLGKGRPIASLGMWVCIQPWMPTHAPETIADGLAPRQESNSRGCHHQVLGATHRTTDPKDPFRHAT